jgi:hypothetical protein
MKRRSITLLLLLSFRIPPHAPRLPSACDNAWQRDKNVVSVMTVPIAVPVASIER